LITAYKPKTSETGTEAVDWLGIGKQHVDSIWFGVVQIVVHDARVVQVERTERI